MDRIKNATSEPLHEYQLIKKHGKYGVRYKGWVEIGPTWKWIEYIRQYKGKHCVHYEYIHRLNVADWMWVFKIIPDDEWWKDKKPTGKGWKGVYKANESRHLPMIIGGGLENIEKCRSPIERIMLCLQKGHEDRLIHHFML